MFLLILTKKEKNVVNFCVFTFHNVSINTFPGSVCCRCLSPLHSIMFLLIQKLSRLYPELHEPLHSIMFLLIPQEQVCRVCSMNLFTFHNVSINTFCGTDNDAYRQIFTFHNVSINTYFSGGSAVLKYPLHSIMFLLIPKDRTQREV